MKLVNFNIKQKSLGSTNESGSEKSRLWILKVVMMVSIGAGVNSSSWAMNALEQQNLFKKALSFAHIEGEKAKALKILQDLATQVPPEDELYRNIQKELHQLDPNNGQFELHKAIQFATGKKTEFYCENKGPVQIIVHHNDGTQSQILMVSGSPVFERTASNRFSDFKGGKWTYAVNTGYREKPLTSDVTASNGSSTSYRIKESRMVGSTQTGDGEYNGVLDPKTQKIINQFHTRGDVSEPSPMFLGVDFLLWANQDAGREIQFKEGSTTETEATETGGPKKLVLSGKRIVGGLLKTHSFIDFKGQRHQFKNCYPVQYEVKLTGYRDYANN